MNTADQDERQFASIPDIVSHCLEKIGGVSPIFASAVLETEMPSRLACGFHISVTGRTQGWVSLTLDSASASDLLENLGEKDQGDDALLALGNELASRFHKTVRERFGPSLLLSEPIAFVEQNLPEGFESQSLFFRLPFQWKGNHSFLLYSLQS